MPGTDEHAPISDAEPAPPGRPLEDRLRDHASIERLASDVLPALIAKLGSSTLAELEVREGDWKVRLRRPADAIGPGYGRRSTDRAARTQPGHEGHRHRAAAIEPHVREGDGAADSRGLAAGVRTSGRGPGFVASPVERFAPAMAGHEAAAEESGTAAPGDATDAEPRVPAGSGNGARHQLAPVGPGPDPGARVGRMGHVPSGEQFAAGGDEGALGAFTPAIATSPAVGIFQVRSDLRSGTRIRAGDRLANVDVLGVPQPVLAPADGLVGATLVEHGEPVEYGQELIRIELAGSDEALGRAPVPIHTPTAGTDEASTMVGPSLTALEDAKGGSAPDAMSVASPGGDRVTEEELVTDAAHVTDAELVPDGEQITDSAQVTDGEGVAAADRDPGAEDAEG